MAAKPASHGPGIKLGLFFGVTKLSVLGIDNSMDAGLQMPRFSPTVRFLAGSNLEFNG